MKTERNFRKATLVALTMTCLWAAAMRIRTFYEQTVPPVSEGECMKFSYPGEKNKYILKVVVNNTDEHMSHVVLTTNAGAVTIENEDDYTFGQIRALKGTKVDCNEEAN